MKSEDLPESTVPERAAPERMVTVWLPDWPVVAAGFRADQLAAVMHANRVVARTDAAAAEGVVIGQRRRQAQRRCPLIELVDHDPARDAREFEPVVRAIAELSPRLDVVEAGWISLAARGPSKYFGGDEQLAAELISAVRKHGRVQASPISPGASPEINPDVKPGASPEIGSGASPETSSGANPQVSSGISPEIYPGASPETSPGANPQVSVGVGIADGRFASSVAARISVRRAFPVLVDPGESASFCEPLPIGWLQALGESDPEMIDLFGRLGLRRLGDLAALSSSDILGRFGYPGVHAHRLASGADVRPPSTTDPSPERRLDKVLEDPAAQAAAVVFVAKQLADELGESLAREGRVCTRLVVVLETEHGERSERSWYRSAGMTAQAMVERVRWQLDAWINLPRGSEQEITGGIALVRLTPDEVRADVGSQLGLWGGQSEADRQAARAIARLTTITSDEAVTVPVWNGGRLPADRYRWVPASMVDLDRRERAVSHAGTGSGPTGPWPGTLPSPSPATVFDEPHPVEVLDADGVPVRVNGRGLVSAEPAQFRLLSGDEASGWRRGRARKVSSWAGPWPVDERWWEPDNHRRLARFQVVTDDNRGYLVIAEHQQWWVSALYD